MAKHGQDLDNQQPGALAAEERSLAPTATVEAAQETLSARLSSTMAELESAIQASSAAQQAGRALFDKLHKEIAELRHQLQVAEEEKGRQELRAVEAGRRYNALVESSNVQLASARADYDGMLKLVEAERFSLKATHERKMAQMTEEYAHKLELSRKRKAVEPAFTTEPREIATTHQNAIDESEGKLHLLARGCLKLCLRAPVAVSQARIQEFIHVIVKEQMPGYTDPRPLQFVTTPIIFNTSNPGGEFDVPQAITVWLAATMGTLDPCDIPDVFQQSSPEIRLRCFPWILETFKILVAELKDPNSDPGSDLFFRKSLFTSQLLVYIKETSWIWSFDCNARHLFDQLNQLNNPTTLAKPLYILKALLTYLMHLMHDEPSPMTWVAYAVQTHPNFVHGELRDCTKLDNTNSALRPGVVLLTETDDTHFLITALDSAEEHVYLLKSTDMMTVAADWGTESRLSTMIVSLTLQPKDRIPRELHKIVLCSTVKHHEALCDWLDRSPRLLETFTSSLEAD